MPEPSIHRTATRNDLPQIVEIYNSTIPSRIATADTEPVSVESRVHWFDEHTPGRRPLWVVEDAGRVVAWLSFSTFYGRPAYARTAELSLYVHEAFRKRGHNEPSLALFQRFGFLRWGELPKVAALDGVERDLIIVGRRIGDPERWLR